ncbi:hypothetical protein IVB45_05740 [Bradyrhizobium sp. 4]|nr:hypothetical protein [Bradyrhizobium sp. 39]MCK1751385.1 hypothetical protein [Bradyrhizobium sp. 135]UPJ36427.1 hypothetical protein IVB45_05740 [Bradyrhizobium sp. 4]
MAGCWSHSRRKLYELHVAGSSEAATTTVEGSKALAGREKRARSKPRRMRCRAPGRWPQISSSAGSRSCGGSAAIQNKQQLNSPR